MKLWLMGVWCAKTCYVELAIPATPVCVCECVHVQMHSEAVVGLCV